MPIYKKSGPSSAGRPKPGRPSGPSSGAKPRKLTPTTRPTKKTPRVTGRGYPTSTPTKPYMTNTATRKSR